MDEQEAELSLATPVPEWSTDDLNFEKLRMLLKIPESHLYEDEYFCCDEDYVWKRPGEMNECSEENAPLFLDNGGSRFDVIQRELKNCWVIVAAVAITQDKELFEKVVPPDQTFDSNHYCGAFYFRFWNDEDCSWNTVIIDDRLPTTDGKLAFARSSKKNEFWGPLLEKAYVKFRRTTYSNLGRGSVKTALQNFTGWIPERGDLREESDDKTDVCSVLMAPDQKKRLVIAGLTASSPHSSKIMGLNNNHVYNVLGFQKIKQDMKETVLIRIRNPLGPGHEYTGDWHDGSNIWNSVSLPPEVDSPFDDDGEFWMDYDRFKDIFHYVYYFK